MSKSKSSITCWSACSSGFADPKGNHPLFPKHPDGSRDLDTEFPHTETWKNMEKLLKTGKTKAIGVSNYSKPYLEELLASCSVIPAANQIENRKLEQKPEAS